MLADDRHILIAGRCRPVVDLLQVDVLAVHTHGPGLIHTIGSKPVNSLEDMNGLKLRGTSKAFAMTGWRIGYSYTSPELADKIAALQSQTTSNATTPAQYAALTAYQAGPEVDEAVALARRYPGELLMEQLVEGDELTVGILAGGDGHVALPSIRIVPKGGWYDYAAKYVAEDTQYLCPGLDGDDEAALRALALDAFDAAGCRGWGRVDVMRDRDSGGFFLLEVNTAPGMTSHSLVPKAAREAGMDFGELCWRILETSL